MCAKPALTSPIRNHDSAMSKFMDPLGDDSEASTSCSDSGDEGPTPNQVKNPSQQLHVDLETLVAGNSVLFVPEPPRDPQDQWDWGSGTDHAEAGGNEDSREAREATRHAVEKGLEQSVALAAKVAMRQAELREAKRKEWSVQQAERRKTYQQKEKRKRDLGMQKSDKDYVQEEKRVARTHGVYSGFDT